MFVIVLTILVMIAFDSMMSQCIGDHSSHVSGRSVTFLLCGLQITRKRGRDVFG